TSSFPTLTPRKLKKFSPPFPIFKKNGSPPVRGSIPLRRRTRKPIKERRPLAAMDGEEPVAPRARPTQKSGDRAPEGNDIEDWIYGQPPSKTIFVRFTGDHVTKIEQFPQ